MSACCTPNGSCHTATATATDTDTVVHTVESIDSAQSEGVAIETVDEAGDGSQGRAPA
ncbi:hypothetical protein [Streptomyces sp. Act143]|uniref:hypothetical protein n=1 Tax=Streptomyces sp. Act143 TaxID=2200760 RepID=UPI0015E7FD0C|nr:hypothetical protein [Streptomyces sp. Act143]